MAEALPLRKSIEQLVEEVRAYIGAKKMPIDVERAVTFLGGKIMKTPLHNQTKEKYRRGIIKTGIRSFILELYTPYAYYEMDSLIHEQGYLSLSLNDWRRTSHGRYEIAHLLGHLFLHMEYRTLGLQGISQVSEKWQQQENFRDAMKYHLEDHQRLEMEANQFAQSFLMPEEEFRKVAQQFQQKKDNKYRLDYIAQHFRVPPLAVERYGERLELFKRDDEDLVKRKVD